jgi:NADH-quinone oxidoreductase subunit L
MIMTFFGEKRWAKDAHPHESPRIMTIPMILLAVGSVLAGALLTLIGAGLQGFLKPVTGKGVEIGSQTLSPLVISLLTLLVVAGGIVAAAVQYHGKTVPVRPPQEVSPVVVAARNDLYADAVNEAVFMRPGQYLTRLLVFFDSKGVDGVVNGLAAFIGGTSGRARRLQTGFVRSYALSMFGGAAFVVAAMLLVRAG